jgi:isochorismate hydrolase
VHVFGDGQAKINLIVPDGFPALVWAEVMKANDLRRAVQLVRDQQEEFLAKWRENHG